MKLGLLSARAGGPALPRRKLVWLSICALAALLLGSLYMRPGDSPSERSGAGAGTGALVAGGLAVAWSVRRARSKARAAEGAGRLRSLERIRLDPGRSLHLIEAEGRRFLVACSTEQGLQLLAHLDGQSSIGQGEREERELEERS
ncbi:MAG: flagellar biosynthetic protein FliO [Deltaproteobacteria bacterium]|nr:flagellar biosynthetic protein FliO [Deltaproteobacteria bacterium]